MLDKAVNESNNTIITPNTEVRFSIELLDNGLPYIKADRQVLKGNSPYMWGNQIEAYINYIIRKGKDVSIKTVEGDTLTLTKNTAGKGASLDANLTIEQYKTKLNAEAHIDEIAQVSTAQKNEFGNNKKSNDFNNKHQERGFGKDGWEYRDAYFMDFDGKYYKISFSVALDKNIKSIYNIGKIKEKVSTNGESRLNASRTVDTSINSISSKTENVNSLDKNNSKKDSNIRYSLAQDPASLKTVANATMDKVYSKKEISKAIDGILEEVLSTGNYQAVLTGAKKQTVIDTLFNAFNTSTGSKRKAVAKDIAQYFIKETALESLYKSEIREQTVENTRVIDAISGYVGALDL